MIWRDDGLWTQLWWICCNVWMRGRMKSFPPAGFVGQAFTSSLDIGSGRWRVRSLKRLPPRPSISRVRLWRLICGLELPLPPSPRRACGAPSGPGGKRWEGAGEDGSTHRIGITSTSPR